MTNLVICQRAALRMGGRPNPNISLALFDRPFALKIDRQDILG